MEKNDFFTLIYNRKENIAMIYNKKYIIDNYLLDQVEADDVELYEAMQHYYTSLDSDEFNELIKATYQLDMLKNGFYI